jgi:hypothetical protein
LKTPAPLLSPLPSEAFGDPDLLATFVVRTALGKLKSLEMLCRKKALQTPLIDVPTEAKAWNRHRGRRPFPLRRAQPLSSDTVFAIS